MDATEAEGLLREMRQLEGRTLERAVPDLRPFWYWAIASLASAPVGWLADTLTARGDRGVGSTRIETVVTLAYWVVAGSIAAYLTLRAYRGRAVEPLGDEPKTRDPVDTILKVVFIVLLVTWIPAILITTISSGIVAYVLTSVAVYVLGRRTNNTALRYTALTTVLMILPGLALSSFAGLAALGVFFALTFACGGLITQRLSGRPSR